MISLFVTITTAAVLFVVWRFWQEEQDVPVRHRVLSDVFLDWKCEVGHSFRRRGQTEPRICPKCSRPSYPVGEYQCPVHGEFEVAVRHSVGADGVARVSGFRIAGGKWGNIEDGLSCPKCKRPLTRKRKDPFEVQGHSRKKSGA